MRQAGARLRACNFEAPSPTCSLSLLAGLAFAALVAACSTFPGGAVISGQVLDFDSRAPIANVQVLALYNSESGIGHSETVCYRVETSTTGADGRYEFPA